MTSQDNLQRFDVEQLNHLSNIFSLVSATLDNNVTLNIFF